MHHTDCLISLKRFFSKHILDQAHLKLSKVATVDKTANCDAVSSTLSMLLPILSLESRAVLRDAADLDVESKFSLP